MMKDESNLRPLVAGSLAHGLHCCFFGTLVLSDFPILREALVQNWKVLLLSGQSHAELPILVQVQNMDSSGQVRTDFPADCLRGEAFRAEAWVNHLQKATLEAQEEGYRRTFCLLDMTWILKDNPDPAGIIDEFETELTRLTHQLPLSVVCCYDRQAFTAEMLLRVLQLHPAVLVGEEPVENHFYASPNTKGGAENLLNCQLASLEKMKNKPNNPHLLIDPALAGQGDRILSQDDLRKREEELHGVDAEMEQRVEEVTQKLEQAYQRIYRMEANLNAIYNSSREIILQFDPDLRLLSYNRNAWEVIHNILHKDIQAGQHMRDILPTELALRIQEIFLRVLDGEQIQQEQKFLSPGGEILWFELTYYPIQVTPEEETHIGISGIDITERKRLADAENTAQEFAEVLTQTLVEMSVDEDINETLGRLLQYFSRVVAYDQAMLLLIEGNQVKVIAEKGFSNTSAIIGKTIPADSSLFQFAAQNQSPLLVKDTLLDQRFIPLEPDIWARSWMIVPLTTQHTQIGYMMMGMGQPGQMQESQAKLAYVFASEVALAIENARLFQQLHQAAATDSLTGTYSRRQLFDMAELELNRAQRYAHPLSTILLDIDLFKQVNDTYGHITGDAVLVKLVEVIRTELRRSDILGRYGGEEFILVLPETDSRKAREVAERIRRKVALIRLYANGSIFSITISLGVATWDVMCKHVDSFFNRADQAMNAAKQGGRNRTVFWTADLE